MANHSLIVSLKKEIPNDEYFEYNQNDVAIERERRTNIFRTLT